MQTETKNKMRAQLTPIITRWLDKFYSSSSNAQELPSVSDELAAQMAEAALIPVFACADLETYQRDNDLLKS